MTGKMRKKKPTDKDSNELSKLKQRVKELENNWKRALADYQNLEKRATQEKDEFCQWANARVLDKLLPVLDSLQKAVEYHQGKGIKLIWQQFRTILESEGVSEIKAKGENFDPETMDAVEVVEGEKNKVIEEVAKGYLLADKVLRPAKVKVGKGG